MTTSKGKTPLTNAQLAAISWADPDESTADLARRIDAPYFTVHKARQRIQRAGGWWCPLTIRACATCGAPLLRATAHPRRVHVACEPARSAHYARQRRAERRPGSLSTPYVSAWREHHPDRAIRLRAREKANRRDRWPHLPPEQRAAALARAHAADARDYPLTRDSADRSGEPWTAEEDEQILARLRDPARDVALDLGRTLWAVRNRRVLLRTRANLPAAPPPAPTQ